MSLHPEEWIASAKRAAVGQQLRVRHRHERTADMNVGNTKDRYWAYCQRCKEGGVVMKTHVAYSPVEVPESRELSMPSDLVWVKDAEPHVQEAVADFLAKKHMDLMYLPDLTGFSESRKRLIIRVGSRNMGRDTSERSPQKWLTYNGQHYMNPAPMSTHKKYAVLVEDCFSMFKVQYALSSMRLGEYVDVFCTLGTAIHDSLFLILLKNYTAVSTFYDGDTAGWNGAAKNNTRLNALGLGIKMPCDYTCAPRDCDPKDMEVWKIQEHMTKLYGSPK